jgi:hypothetical protein
MMPGSSSKLISTTSSLCNKSMARDNKNAHTLIIKKKGRPKFHPEAVNGMQQQAKKSTSYTE